MASLRSTVRQFLHQTGLRPIPTPKPPVYVRPVPYAAPRPDGNPVSFDELAEYMDPAQLPPLDRPGVDLPSLTPEQRSWWQDGAVELKGFLPDDLVDAYVAERSKLDHLGWLQPTPYLHVPSLRDLAMYPPLMAVMESLISEPLMLHLALTGWISTARAWHQDDYLNPPHVASWYTAVWIALDDIHPDSGPFEYLPGSHRWPLLRRDVVMTHLTDEELQRKEKLTGHNSWERYAERFVTPAVDRKVAESGLPIRQFLGKKGDVLIWHGALMHRGSVANVPLMPRKSLITHYSGINHRPDMAKRKQHEGGGTYALFDHPFG
ncbi:phytanoyl-CoA dioxygenase family protein [Acidisoma cellulosilytica]|uniref:Phytanoyl-CoA dioxygenase family protein n=1 Tax=Acidisoma cellulosilyticum TaxID=2802395 RepID=A0A963YY37_9PROT|nr:phytanoyl-CoA dioxygenase family protein [Acidisoma cellulosilyticum]MCB8879289.1 phytanoyl-CoA dioxygenase family protein [Acidisoma cellulosilyticum]